MNNCYNSQRSGQLTLSAFFNVVFYRNRKRRQTKLMTRNGGSFSTATLCDWLPIVPRKINRYFQNLQKQWRQMHP